MQAIAGIGLPIVSDEIYHGRVSGEKEHCILEYTDDAFVLNGFSKLFAMTGWRLGYIIAPPDFIRPLQKVQQNFFHLRRQHLPVGRRCGAYQRLGRRREDERNL